MKSFTLQGLNALLKGKTEGDTNQNLTGLEQIDKASSSVELA